MLRVEHAPRSGAADVPAAGGVPLAEFYNPTATPGSIGAAGCGSIGGG